MPVAGDTRRRCWPRACLPKTPPLRRRLLRVPHRPQSTREAMEGADVILALGTLITDDYLDLLALAYEP